MKHPIKRVKRIAQMREPVAGAVWLESASPWTRPGILKSIAAGNGLIYRVVEVVGQGRNLPKKIVRVVWTMEDKDHA